MIGPMYTEDERKSPKLKQQLEDLLNLMDRTEDLNEFNKLEQEAVNLHELINDL